LALIIADRVRDTTTTTGTGNITVSGTAPITYRTFSAVCSVSDTFPYFIAARTLNEWEVGLATYTSSNTIARTQIFSSSNAGSLVSFSAGTKDVVLSQTAEKTGTGNYTVTSSMPFVDWVQTWNNGAALFTGIKSNITDTASATGSNLVDLQVGSVSKFKVDKAGNVVSGNIPISTNSPTDFLCADKSWKSVASLSGALVLRSAIPSLTISVDTFITSGFAADGDYGSGAMYTSNGASSAGPMAIQDAVGTWFQLVIIDVIKAGWFGVTANGVSNDSSALQAAIDYAANNTNGGVVQLSNGTTLANVIIKSGVQLFGAEGMFNVGNNVELKAWGTGAIIDSPVTNINTASVVGISLVGLGAGTPCQGIHLRNANWCKIEHCFFDQFADEAIIWDAGFALQINKILAQNSLLNRTRSESGVVTINGSDAVCYGCEVTASVSGITVNGNCAAWLIGSGNHFFESCIGEISDTGWDLGNNPFLSRWVNCRSDTNETDGWHISGFYNIFSACVSYNDGQATTNTYFGFNLTPATKQAMLTSCVVTGSSTLNACFADVSTNSSSLDRNKFVSCEGDNYGSNGLVWLPNSAFVAPAFTVSNSVIKSTSGSTISVTAATVLVLAYSGATNVTNFTNGVNGNVLKVLGDGNVTLVNGASIVTNTGANKLLALNKIYTFTNIAGVWYENA
jgi:hypothetical protein